MRILSTLATFTLLGWSLLGCREAAISEPSLANESLLIHNARLISPERTDVLEDAWVLIRDQRIEAVGSAATEPLPAIDNRLDAEGRFLIPGLIDSHVHLAGVPGVPVPVPRALKSMAEAYERQLPRSYLYFGFTTLVDLNVVDRPAIRRFRDADVAPDLYDCGGALALANGYPMAFMPEEYRFASYPNFLWDPRQEDRIPSRFHPEEHTPAAAVARVAESGGICIKTHFEDGFGPAKIWPTPTARMIDDVIVESRERGLTVTMHANSFEAQRFAADAGVDVIVHGLWNWDGLRPENGELPEPIRQLLDEIIERQIGFQATIQVLAGLGLMYDPAFLADPHVAAVLPTALIDWYQSDAGGWFREELRGDYGGLGDEDIRRAIQGGVDEGVMVVRYLAENGGRLLFGSDTPSSPTYGNPPGYNGFLELLALADAGLSPGQVLRAATLDNAEAFHLEDHYGTVTPGKIANLLLLEANPLESVEAYDTLSEVILRGRPIPRQTLKATK